MRVQSRLAETSSRNASWTGYRVRDLLADAGVHADADMVLSKSSDGFTAGTPVEALDRRPRRTAGHRDERPAAAHRPRLPRAARRARPVRLRVGHQMGCGP